MAKLMDTCLSRSRHCSTDTPSSHTPSRPAWYPDWIGRRVVIIASGPSATEQPIDLIRGRARVIAINNSWRLAPWADVLYASDWQWWAEEDTTAFTGLKISRCDVPGVNKVDLIPLPRGQWHDELVLTDPPRVGAGGHGGFQAIDLAYQFGARDIALVGMDMRIDRGVHWHGKHTGKRGNPHEGTVEYWRSCTDRQAPRLAAHGARVVNCSLVSTLRNYPKIGLEMWLDEDAGRERAA